tara:strand:+ start:2569 stop:2835 length:267 start_codon:yes stop_codon:yes gene_type:complete
MAPYEPPVAHYTQLNVPDIDEDTMFEFVGKNGYRFYRLTRELGVRYLWYDKERKVIEVWGSYSSLLRDPCTKLRQNIDEWLVEKNIQD